jgi:hypothetical protein
MAKLRDPNNPANLERIREATRQVKDKNKAKVLTPDQVLQRKLKREEKRNA